MLIVRSTCSCALACGGDKARETGRSALVSDEGGWHPPDNEVASPNASEPVSASLHHWRSANLPEVVKPAEVRTAFSVPVAARGEFYDPLQDKSYACHLQLLLAPEQSVFLDIQNGVRLSQNLDGRYHSKQYAILNQYATICRKILMNSLVSCTITRIAASHRSQAANIGCVSPATAGPQSC